MTRHYSRANLEAGILSFLCVFTVLGGHSLSTYGQEPVDFAHDILPVLRARCAECHSNGVFKGGLSLESREALLDSGAVDVGSHADSELYVRITSTDADERMPPDGEQLSPAQMAAFARWIDDGAVWPVELSLRKKKFTRPLSLSRIELPGNDDGDMNPVDRLITRYFQENAVEYPEPPGDHEMLRRLKLDLLGLLPTADELDAFVKDDESDKYEQLVDDFLSRDRDYADHWISFWNDLLRNDYAGTGYIDGGRKQITGWLHRSLMENKPYDQFVRELVDPTRESMGFINGIKWRGEVNASQIQPLQFSQNISQVFLGINMKCASCHDSFIDEWKLTDAYGLAAVFSEQPLELHRCDVPTGAVAASQFVFPTIGEIDGALPRSERLEQLAGLMTSKKNGRLSRTIVNRIWDRMFGRGIVHPVDVMANRAWSESLLEYLALDLVENGYDLKRTLRLIVTSRIYRSRSRAVVTSAAGDSFVFRGVQRKRMTAEQFMDAIWQLTGTGPEEMVAEIADSERSARKAVRASLVNSNALMRSLGRPNREQVVTTRPSDLSTLQALDLSNGALLAGLLKRGAANRADARKSRNWTSTDLITQLFVEALSRTPTEEELEIFQLEARNRKDDISQSDIEDVLWIIIMLPEFQLIR